MSLARPVQTVLAMKSISLPALDSSTTTPSQVGAGAPEAQELRRAAQPPSPTPPRHPAPVRHEEPLHRPSRRSWSLRRTKDAATLVATFRGKLSEAEGKAFAAAFAEELTWAPAHIIWNLTEMTGYEAAARVAWQEALLPLKQRIRSLEVVGGSPLVRVGAVTLAMVLGVEARFVEGPPVDGQQAARSAGRAAA